MPRTKAPIIRFFCFLFLGVPVIGWAEVNQGQLRKILKTLDDVHRKWEHVPITATVQLEVHDPTFRNGAWISRIPKAYLNIFTDSDSFWASFGPEWYCRIAEMSAQSNGHTIRKREIETDNDLVERRIVTTSPAATSSFRRIFDPWLTGYCYGDMWLSDWIRKKPPTELRKQGKFWKLSWLDRSAPGISCRSLYLDETRGNIIIRRLDTYIDKRSSRRTVEIDRSVLRTLRIRDIYLPTQFISSVDGDQGASLGLGRVTLSNISVSSSPLLKSPIEQPGDIIRNNFGVEYQVQPDGSLKPLPSRAQKLGKIEREAESDEVKRYGFAVFAITAIMGITWWIVSGLLAKNKLSQERD